MARKIYFSFHYQDVIDFRANVVRNSHTFRKGNLPFRDASIWEEVAEKRTGIIKSLIDSSLIGTSTTCVLIGSETYSRRWVRYEIIKSFAQKKAMLGVGINWIKGRNKKTKFWPGENPFGYLKLIVSKDGQEIHFFEYKEDQWVKYRDLPYVRNTHISKENAGKEFIFSKFYKTHSYVWKDGVKNLGEWIEFAINTKP